MEVSETIPQILMANYEKWGHRTAMCRKRFGVWQQYNWRAYYENVKCSSLGLISLGLEPGDVVCIIGDNEPEWFWAEFATQAAAGVPTGIFVDSSPAEVKYIAVHSDAKFAVVNDQEQTDKFLQIKHELPSLRKVIYWDPKGLRKYNDPILVNFAHVTKLGREYEEAHPGLFEQNVKKLKADDIAFIYYTSGTTDLPKGAMLTHRALINTARGFIGRYPLYKNDDLISNFPAAWVGDSFFSTIPHLLTGARLNFPEEPETIAEDTREVGPNFVSYGPRQWEGLVREIRAKMMSANRFTRYLYDIFMAIGHKTSRLNSRTSTPSPFWLAANWLGNMLLFRPLKDRLGLSRVRFAVTGSSVISLDAFRLIHAIGTELRQNYGSTEAGFISCHSKGEINVKSVGRPVRGTEVRVTDEGELLVRSDCLFSGYHKDPERTARTLIDGWCRTGDAVHINEEGHLVFLDRLEHIAELESGNKYAPQHIEARLRFSPYIKDAMVIGGKNREFVSAILNIDSATVGKWAERNRVAYGNFVELSQKEEVADLVRKDLVQANGHLPQPIRVKKFVLLHREFDPDEAEITRTKKLRRDFMEGRYEELINAIYDNGTEIDVEAPVTYRDGRKGILTTAIKVRSI